MKHWTARLKEAMDTVLWGPPCARHPGHRVREYADPYELVPGRWCLLCLQEHEAREAKCPHCKGKCK